MLALKGLQNLLCKKNYSKRIKIEIFLKAFFVLEFRLSEDLVIEKRVIKGGYLDIGAVDVAQGAESL